MRKRIPVVSVLLVGMFVMRAMAAEIHEAVLKGDVARVRAILEKDRQPVHSRDFRVKATPLAVAVLKGDSDCVSVLLENGAEVDGQADEEGVTIPMLAATAADDDVRMAHYDAELRRIAERMPEGETRRRSLSLIEEFEKSAIPQLRGKLAELPFPATPERIKILEMVLARKPDLKPADKRGMTVMHYAAKFCAADVCELLVSHGGDVNLRSRDWRTPLHEAVAAVNLKAAEFLLNRGADVEKETREGECALHIAASNGSLPLVDMLLAKSAQPDLSDSRGATPLHLAAQAGRTEVAARLLAAGADIGAEDVDGMTPLHYAGSYGRVEMVQFLLKRGAKLESSDREGFTPLLYAAEKGQMKVFEALLAAGADPRRLVNDKRTVLHLVCSNFPSPEWIERLVNAGVPVDGADINHFTPLHSAAQWGRRDAVERLLKHGANPNAATSNRNTPLIFAGSLGEDVEISMGETKGTKEDYQAICDMLVHAGARFDVIPKNGWTLLHAGACIGNRELLGRALESGVPIDSKNDSGMTPLHLAAERGFAAAVEFLLSHGADANAVNDSGDTPIYLAAAKSSGELIELLARHGARIDVRDPKLKTTPLHIAAAFHNVSAVKALLALGADVSARDHLGDTPLHPAVSIHEIEKIHELGPASRDAADMFRQGADAIAAIRELQSAPLLLKLKTELAAGLASSRATDSPARSLETTRLLLEYGASPTAKDLGGLTPIDVANANGTPEIVRLLENPPKANRKTIR